MLKKLSKPEPAVIKAETIVHVPSHRGWNWRGDDYDYIPPSTAESSVSKYWDNKGDYEKCIQMANLLEIDFPSEFATYPLGDDQVIINSLTTGTCAIISPDGIEVNDNNNDEIYDEIIERFSEREEPELLERVAKALHNKGYVLSLMKQPTAEIAVYDEIVSRFGGSDIESLSQSAVQAMNKKAAVLIELGPPQEALAEYDSVLKLSPGNPVAHNGRIYALIKSGKAGEAFSHLEAALDSDLMDVSGRSALASILVTDFINEESHLKKIIDTFILRDATKPLVTGLIAWLQGLLPITKKADADRLMETEEMLGKLLADVPDAQFVLSMLKAASADAQGDKKALLALPLELRRLIQSAKGEEVDD
ncbi:MAG: hypothetical protein IIB43_07320 [Candidatus Marinimicrobia bacterium]|nr:hypothetical protein [Candidatus Neomarinimicrobiota bacterium]